MSDSPKDKSPLRGDQLSSLYPTPKTFEERRLEQEERDMRRLARLPKYPAFSVGIRLYAACVVLPLATLPVPGLLESRNKLIFAWFVIALICFGFIVWMVVSAIGIFRKLDRNPSAFFAVYAGISIPVGLGLYVLFGATPPLYAALTLVHFALVYVVVKLMLRQIVVR